MDAINIFVHNPTETEQCPDIKWLGTKFCSFTSIFLPDYCLFSYPNLRLLNFLISDFTLKYRTYLVLSAILIMSDILFGNSDKAFVVILVIEVSSSTRIEKVPLEGFRF